MARAHILSIGDELLQGIRTNTNLTYLGGMLGRHGVSVTAATTVRDRADEIRAAFECARQSADLVVTTGGLGPTGDDLTRETMAEALGLELEFCEEVAEAIRSRLAKLGRTAKANNLKQAYRPAGATVLPNHFGTAPGLYIRKEGKALLMLPGPATEMKPMFEKQAIPALAADGLATPTDAYFQIRTAGVGESHLEELVEPLFAPLADRLQLAFCAHAGMVDIRLSAKEDGLDVPREPCEQFAAGVRDLLGEDYVCTGFDPLAKTCIDRLRVLDRSIAVAESCTGGLLANAFTDIPGASKVFEGGVVCYQNAAKVEMCGVPESIIEQHGAVSAECAVALATGVAERFSSEYGLAVTGFAGPGGGTNENPVGTIFLGYCSPCGAWSRRVVYPGNRLAVKERAVNTALDWLRRKLHKYFVKDMLATQDGAASA